MADTPDHNRPAAADDGATGDQDGVTRRQFLTGATVAVGGVMGGLLVGPVAGMALSPALGRSGFEPLLIGRVDEFSTGSFTKVVLQPGAGSPDAYVRKLVAFVRANESKEEDALAPSADQKPSFLDSGDAVDQWPFTIVSNICVHLGCPVQASTSGFVCPCHGGSYDDDGARTAGPPVRPLDRYWWVQRGDELWALARYSLSNDGGVAKRHDPGQHTGGPEGLFYPLQP